MLPKRYSAKKLITYSESQFFSLLGGNNDTSVCSNLRVLDAIMFKRDLAHKAASLWYYTDQNGRFTFRNLNSMQIPELVIAILCNVNGTKELTHDSVIVPPLIATH